MRLKQEGSKLKLWHRLMIVFVMAAFVTLLTFNLQPNGINHIMKIIDQNQSQMMFIYNWLPVLVVMLFFYFLFGNLWLGTGIGTALFLILSIANRYKILYRNDPFVPMDLKLGKEAKNMVTEGGFSISIGLIALFVTVVAIQFYLGYRHRKKKPNLILRITGIAICLLVINISNEKIYASSDVYDKLPVIGNTYNVTNHFSSKGFIYCFLYNLSAFVIEKPEGYEKKAVEKWIEENNQAQPNTQNSDLKSTTSALVKPHVIMVMGEAFSDFTNETDLKFNKGQNPLKFYNKMISKEAIVSGQLVVPSYGGGTANTEFEALTGGSNLLINKSNTTAFKVIRKDIESVPKAFESLGYKTVGMHPGHSWFYNRRNVYNYLGFDQAHFIQDFEQVKKRTYIAESATIDKVIETFETHTSKSDAPLFEFCVTIQNHGPYDESNHYSEKPVAFKTNKKLSPTGKTILSNYLIGLKDADHELERMVKYFESVNEPVVVVYFGDHLPYMGDDYLVYKELGVNLSPDGNIQQRLNAHKTPFFIWGNSEAKKTMGLSSIDSVQPMEMNASYLSALVFDLIGEGDVTPYTHYLNDMRKTLPVFGRSEFKVEGQYTNQLASDSKASDLLNKYVDWQYYRMK